MAVAWSAFTPNARLFGRVVGPGSTPSRWSRSRSTTGRAPSTRRPCSTRCARRARGRRSSCSAATSAHTPTGPQDRGRGPRAREPRRRPLAAHLRRAAGDRAPVPGGRQALPPQSTARRRHLFRAPHGFRGPFVAPVARQLGYRIVGWNGAIFDTARPGVDAIVDRCANVLAPGRDPAAARRRRLRAGRRPLADGRGAAAHPRDGAGARPRAGDRLGARRGAAAAAADGVQGRGVRDRVAAWCCSLAAFELQVVADVFTEGDPLYVLAALFANLVSVAAKALTWKAAFDAIPGDDEGRPLDVGCATSSRRSSSASC